MEDLETIREFLIESSENLTRLDQEIVELERDPGNVALVASIFRTIHTIKGTCGFLGFNILTEVSHVAESILSQVRDGKRKATKPLIDITLQAVDAIKQILSEIEATNHEGSNHYETLVGRLKKFAECSEAQEAAIANAACVSAAPAPIAAATPPITPTVAESASDQKLATEKASSPTPAAPIAAPEIHTTSDEPVASRSEAPKGKAASGSVSDSTIRVDVGLLDKLMNLVGELVLARNQVLQYNLRRSDAAFNATSQRLNLITSELQESVMKTRMQPIGIIWNKLPRVVRDLASELGKQINLTMDGAETELDRTIIEAIKDPLTHLVRNSCDHGVERPDERVSKGKPGQGRLMLRAFHEGGHVNIEIIDDGRGLDPAKLKAKALQKGLITAEQAERMSDREAINTIFLPGFSTAEQVSNISGRGVGMDVVKTNIERIGGAVELQSGHGPGTTVKIKIPLTLAIIPGLVVTCGADRFVIPQMNLSELIRLEGETGRKQIERIHGTPVYRRRGKLLPLVFLNEVLGLKNQPLDVMNVVVLQAEGREFGLVVENIHDTQEIVVKPLGKQCKSLAVYSGATIMGDGRVALILDLPGIAQRCGMRGGMPDRSALNENESASAELNERQTLLIFSAAGLDRVAVPLSTVARLEELDGAQIERAAGQYVVQYRGQILPLCTLDGSAPPLEGTVPVVVFSNADRLTGLVVDQVLDILEERIEIGSSKSNSLMLGSAVIGGRITDFLDLQALLQNDAPSWTKGTSLEGEASSARPRVLVVDESKFERGMLRTTLELGGFRVIEACDTVSAMAAMRGHRPDVVVTESKLIDLAETIQQTPDLSSTPIIGLVAAADMNVQTSEHAGFDECLLATEREALLHSLRRLAMALERSEAKPLVGA